MLDLNGEEAVPAYFVKPLGAEGPCPACSTITRTAAITSWARMSCLTGARRCTIRLTPQALTARGYAALCIDHWCFGERRGRRRERYVFKEMLWRGDVLWGMMVYDSLRAVDYLVDTSRCECGTAWPRWASPWAAPWPGG